MITNYQNGLQFNSKSLKELHLYLGYELEFDGDNPNRRGANVAQEIKDLWRANGFDVDYESDCSLSYGKELVFPPTTLSVYQDNTHLITKSFRILQEAGFTNSNRRAGGHIHISRRTLGKSHEARNITLEKIIHFFEDNRDDLYKFSRRTEGARRWCRIYNTHQGRYERYQAINVQNRHTVEFRLFTAPISATDWLANGQLVQALVQTAKSRHKDLNTLTLDELITQYKRKYKELYNYWRSL